MRITIRQPSHHHCHTDSLGRIGHIQRFTCYEFTSNAIGVIHYLAHTTTGVNRIVSQDANRNIMDSDDITLLSSVNYS